MRIKHFFFLAFAAMALVALLAPDVALAQTNGNGGIFQTLSTKGTSTFSNLRVIMFIIAGFGIIGMAAMAFFGKFDWRWTFSMGGGLIILAAAGGIIYYATHAEEGGTIGGGLSTLQGNDTLQ
ncbi:MAG: hypothetical protein DI537_28395 [Stutzerimonas stutzeri]|nr:MAG: hypothetical protein DI537_28395 [Stutzerimonas stutzeri]